MTKREIKQYHQTNCKHGQKQISKEGIKREIRDDFGYMYVWGCVLFIFFRQRHIKIMYIIVTEWYIATNGFKTTAGTKENGNGKIIKNADGTYILLKSNDTEQRF